VEDELDPDDLLARSYEILMKIKDRRLPKDLAKLIQEILPELEESLGFITLH
jgi:hypothetical protein